VKCEPDNQIPITLGLQGNAVPTRQLIERAKRRVVNAIIRAHFEQFSAISRVTGRLACS
jgi:hypothetical protein